MREINIYWITAVMSFRYVTAVFSWLWDLVNQQRRLGMPIPCFISLPAYLEVYARYTTLPVCAQIEVPQMCPNLRIKFPFLLMTSTSTLYRELLLQSAIWGTGFYFPLDNEIVVSITVVDLTSILCQKSFYEGQRDNGQKGDVPSCRCRNIERETKIDSVNSRSESTVGVIKHLPF